MRLILLLLSLCVLPAVAQETPPQARPEIRGVWIHTYAPWDWDAVMPKIAAAGFNCVFVRVARGVNAIYPSALLPRDGWAEGLPDDELAKAIAAAHRNGLEFHAWKVNFNANAGMRAGESVKRFYEQMAADDRLVRDPDGKQASSLNPADPRNQELEFQVMLELATKYPVDGIHFDYIRYPDEPSYDFDYGPVSRAEFEKTLGRAVANWPRDVIAGEDKIAYEDWERDNVNRLVQRVHDEVKRVRPQCQISAAVWRKHRKYRAAIKQDWIKWVNEGWLDFVCPMDYTKDHEEFRADVRAQVANTSGKMPLAAGIGSYLQATPDDVIKQIQIAREEGADGYVLFDYKREGMDALLDALAQGPQKERVEPALRKPKTRGFLVGGILRKDDVQVFPAGGRLHWAGPVHDEITAITLEDSAGNIVGQLKRVTGIDPNQPSLEFDGLVPPGRSRVVFSRQPSPLFEQVWPFGKWSTRPFEQRGQWIEGLPPEQFAALQTAQNSPEWGEGRHVAVYSDGQAAKGILFDLRADTSLAVASIAYLSPAFLGEARVLFLPQLNDVADLSQPVVNALRKWVSDGGKLILTHDAVGWRWHPRMFPTVGQGNGLAKGRKIEILANDFGLTPAVYETNLATHVTIEPGPDGVVLAKDENGAPVIVGGKVGKGTVILCGALLGYMPDGKLAPEEERLIQELAR